MPCLTQKVVKLTLCFLYFLIRGEFNRASTRDRLQKFVLQVHV